jgi:hypothetical protein
MYSMSISCHLRKLVVSEHHLLLLLLLFLLLLIASWLVFIFYLFYNMLELVIRLGEAASF